MAASAIAIPTFGNGRALIATDLSGDVHTLTVTTDAPTSGFAVWGFGATKYILGSTESDGVHTPCVTTDEADDAIAIWGWNAQKYVLATKAADTLSNGETVHALCVSTDTPDSEIAIPGFASGVIVLATKESGGVHTLCVSDAESGDAPQALWEWGNQKVILVADTAGSGPAVVPLVMGLAPPYDPDAQAWFDAVSWGNEDLTQKQAVNDFIVALKDGGVWSLLDRLWLIANRDQTAAMTCLKSLEAMTPVNAPTFTQWRGVNGNGSSSYVNTNYQPKSDGVNYTLNDACAFVDVINNVAESHRRTFAAEEGAARLGLVVDISGTWYAEMNTAAAPALNGSGAASAAVLILIQRTGSSAIAGYCDNSLGGSDTDASTDRPDIPVFLGARNAGGVSAFSAKQCALLGFGASLDSGQRSTFQAARDALKSAIGW